MSEAILGISAYYHDSAAALIINGDIKAAAHEERFTRKKHDSSFPANAVKYVLNENGLELSDLQAVVFYEKPFLKFERLLETYHAFAPKGLVSFLSAMPVWMKEKLFMRKIIKDELKRICGKKVPKLFFPEHHLSHAASAFFPSPFENAAILTVDGVGEWATTTIGAGRGNSIEILRQLNFPHSLGLLYSAFTYYCGFKVNSGEYKLMGLAPYGDLKSQRVKKWTNLITDELIDIRDDGSFLLNMDYFNYATGLTMCHNKKWEKLFGIQKREKETKLTQYYMDLAMAVQNVTEQVIFMLARTARELTAMDYLTIGGGVALNCVANGKLLRKKIFKDLWIQPAAGDAGGSLGAALAQWHIGLNKPRETVLKKDSMKGSYLGPKFDRCNIQRTIKRYNADYTEYDGFKKLCSDVAELIDKGNIVGWFQGRMEYGPRALGNRSILGDARHPEMQKKMNLKIKYREGFRPFAPAVLEEDVKKYFETDSISPYMLLVSPVNEERRKSLPLNYEKLELLDKLYHIRSDIPAVTHIDYSSRVQTVSKDTNEKFWTLINSFKEKTGYGLLVNTSFNVRGEPIVCTPNDAYRCFMVTEIDYLVIENFLFDKTKQQAHFNRQEVLNQYELD